jgi:hypothetical protein
MPANGITTKMIGFVRVLLEWTAAGLSGSVLVAGDPTKPSTSLVQREEFESVLGLSPMIT